MKNFLKEMNEITREFIRDMSGHWHEITTEPVKFLGITIRKVDKIKIFIPCEQWSKKMIEPQTNMCAYEVSQRNLEALLFVRIMNLRMSYFKSWPHDFDMKTMEEKYGKPVSSQVILDIKD